MSLCHGLIVREPNNLRMSFQRVVEALIRGANGRLNTIRYRELFNIASSNLS